MPPRHFPPDPVDVAQVTLDAQPLVATSPLSLAIVPEGLLDEGRPDHSGECFKANAWAVGGIRFAKLF